MSMNKKVRTGQSRQSGLVLVLMTLSLVILIGYMALAIDFSHLLLNKSRLQNGIDSASLSAAVVVDNTGDMDLARSAAISALTAFLDADGNSEVKSDYDDSVKVQFSNDPTDFNSVVNESTLSSTEDIYVRVSIEQHSLTNYFLKVFGINKDIRASGVAGPSAALDVVCNVVPMAVCSIEPDGTDKVFKDKHVYILKDDGWQSTGLGSGNFQLLDFGVDDDSIGSAGGRLVRDYLAGEYQGCGVIGDRVTTKPGSTVGNVKKGLQIRIDSDEDSYSPNNAQQGEYEIADGGDPVPVNTQWNYELYTGDGTRVVTVPMLDCSDTDKDSGKHDVKVSGFGCFFLVQKTDGKEVYAEFLEECPIKNGTGGLEPGDAGLYKIQLYKDPHSGDS